MIRNAMITAAAVAALFSGSIAAHAGGGKCPFTGATADSGTTKKSDKSSCEGCEGSKEGKKDDKKGDAPKKP